ncbi:hypothetical protein CDL15_Pgr021642 [Punica granatum]|uniref:Uncharacterized protein n=1 Tax=Punica granatum TaxID=22663 RepID=A0A218WSN8_PUNGR|nr:hypothetical protein CDL15_Pgr021642 [Punica granatum]
MQSRGALRSPAELLRAAREELWNFAGEQRGELQRKREVNEAGRRRKSSRQALSSALLHHGYSVPDLNDPPLQAPATERTPPSSGQDPVLDRGRDHHLAFED